MKNLLLLACFAFALGSCKQNVDLSREMPGTYSMIDQIINQNDKTTSLQDLKQLKIYTDKHFMFTQINPRDSIASFGVGSYSVEGDSVIEHRFYSSSGKTFTDQPANFSLFITRTPLGYSQIIKDIMIDSVNSTLTEHYRSVEDTTTSPLDGVWKELKSFLVVGKDTLPNLRTQYKAFYRGYFMFGNTVQVGSNQTVAGMGYGTFKKTGPSTMEETDLNSSYPFIAGNTFEVSYVMQDNDHYSQVVKNLDGSLGIEYYERVK